MTDQQQRTPWALNLGTPLWCGVLTDLDACANCLCTDCGCCVGCGGINADMEGGHGYACI